MNKEEYRPPVEEPPQKVQVGKVSVERRRRRGWLWLPGLIALAIVLYYVWPRKGASNGASTAPPTPGLRMRGPGVVPVDAAKTWKGNIGVYVTGLGSVTPVYTITVASQISGYLMNVFYKQGQTVHKGDMLALIDPRPYQVMLENDQAALARDTATYNNAIVDLHRYQVLVPERAETEQTLATQAATVKSDAAVLKTDQAAIDTAKLDLVYCNIKSPIDGRVGLRLVDPGNYVTAGSTSGLVVVTQIQPITVIFTISEDQLPEVYRRWHAGERLAVYAYDHTNTTQIATGYLETIDNQIDPTTGTVKLRALFNNSDGALFANEFVNARLLVEEKRGVTLAPSEAVQRNSQVTYVYVVNPANSTVSMKMVKVGTTEGNDTQITSGLSPGQVVVITGVDKLQNGSKVRAHLGAQSPGTAKPQLGA
jgi:membrane fusion protein, multidrug efflux system